MANDPVPGLYEQLVLATDHLGRGRNWRRRIKEAFHHGAARSGLPRFEIAELRSQEGQLQGRAVCLLLNEWIQAADVGPGLRRRRRLLQEGVSDGRVRCRCGEEAAASNRLTELPS